MEKRRRNGGDGGCPTSVGRKRNRGETAESEKRDATPNLLLKHPDATLATYV
jgi:hypothetical protein